MDTKKINKGSVKMVAHRGVSGLERENTCPAFVAAGNRSYYGIETDIHVGYDGEFIVIHDRRTGRVSEGAFDVDVESTPYDALRELVLPDKDGSFVRQDIRIPVLEEYISICKKYGNDAKNAAAVFYRRSKDGTIRRFVNEGATSLDPILHPFQRLQRQRRLSLHRGGSHSHRLRHERTADA